MSTVANVGTFARAQAQTDSDGLTDTNLIVWANESMVDFRRRLQTAGVDAAQVQETYASFTAGTGTYAWPTDMAWLKALELNYVNDNPQDYKTATQIDVSNIPGRNSFGWTRKHADRNAPLFDDRGDWFEVFPTPTSADNATNAIRIFYFLEPTEYTATTDTISYPESLDYRILGWRVTYLYLRSLGQERKADAEDALVEYEKRVKDLISTLARGSQMPVQAKNIQLTGFEF